MADKYLYTLLDMWGRAQTPIGLSIPALAKDPHLYRRSQEMISGGLQTSSVNHVGHDSGRSNAAPHQAPCSLVYVHAWRQRCIKWQNCTMQKQAACALSTQPAPSAYQKEHLRRPSAWHCRKQHASAACAASSGTADSAPVHASSTTSSDSKAFSAVLRFLQGQFLPLALIGAMIAG